MDIIIIHGQHPYAETLSDYGQQCVANITM